MEGSRLWIVVDPVQPHVLMEALVCWRLIAAAVFARALFVKVSLLRRVNHHR